MLGADRRMENMGNIGRAALLLLMAITLTTVLYIKPVRSVRAVTLKFSGTVDTVDDPTNLLGGAIIAGDAVNGSFVYDLDTVDSDPDPTIGHYRHTSAPFGIFSKINGFTFETNSADTNFWFDVLNDVPDVNTDNLFLFSHKNNFTMVVDPSTIETKTESMLFALSDPSMTALSNTDLPSSIDLSKWSQRLFSILANYTLTGPTSVQYYIVASIDTCGLALIGDVDMNGIVDIFDVIFWAGAFGTKATDPNYKRRADLDPNGVLDIFDGVTISQHFGETGDP